MIPAVEEQDKADVMRLVVRSIGREIANPLTIRTSEGRTIDYPRPTAFEEARRPADLLGNRDAASAATGRRSMGRETAA